MPKRKLNAWPGKEEWEKQQEKERKEEGKRQTERNKIKLREARLARLRIGTVSEQLKKFEALKMCPYCGGPKTERDERNGHVIFSCKKCAFTRGFKCLTS